MNRTHSGFTLIELLVVVAIIGILVAIAVVNYLGARIKANVGRALADMQSLGTAIDAYFVDQEQHPASHFWGTSDDALVLITTPIAYIGTLPRDIFNDTDYLWYSMTDPPGRMLSGDKILIKGIYVYMSCAPSHYRFFHDYTNFTGRKWPEKYGWQIRSLGPNSIEDRLRRGASPDDVAIPYDPTNGIRSAGDLARFSDGTTLGSGLAPPRRPS